jgi:hypothetical protein
VSGYRESSFDPSAGGDYGPPLRPFNRVQWTGVGFIAFGVGLMLAAVAGTLGLFARRAGADMLPMGTTFAALGTVLINSRRSPASLSADTRRRRTVIFAVALAVGAITAGAIIYFKGAHG